MEDLDLLTLNGRQLSSATLQQQYMGPWTGLYCCVLRTVTAVDFVGNECILATFWPVQ